MYFIEHKKNERNTKKHKVILKPTYQEVLKMQNGEVVKKMQEIISQTIYKTCFAKDCLKKFKN